MCGPQRQCLKWQNSLKKKKTSKFLVDSGEHSNFSVKKDVCVVSLRDLSSALKTNLSLQDYQEDECKPLIKAQQWPLLKVAEWLIVAIKEYLFVNETSSSTVMETNRCLFDSLWVQLKKFASLISWPPWLENQQSWIIEIGAEFIIQISPVLSEKALHEGQNYLLCDDKVFGFRNWLIEAWMSADTGRVKISRFCSDSEKQKQVLQETDFLCVRN